MIEINYEHNFDISKHAIYAIIEKSKRLVVIVNIITLLVALIFDNFHISLLFIIPLLLVFSFLTTAGANVVICFGGMIHSKKALNKLSDRNFNIQFTDEMVKIKTSFFCSEIPWTTFTGLTVTKKHWFFWLGNQIIVAIPATNVDDKLGQMIRTKIK